MAFRILASVLFLFSVLFLPFWISAILALVGMAYFAVFWEAVVLFLLSDLLHGVGEAKFGGIVFVSFIASLVALIITEAVKKRLR